MKVLFVYPNVTGHESIHQGLIWISSYLKHRGHSTSLIDFTFARSDSFLLAKLKEFAPDIIGFTATSGMFRPAIEFAEKIKKNYDVPIIFGGPHATVVPEKVIKEKAVDLVCINEGEEAMAELLQKMEKNADCTDVRNLWVKRDGKIYKNPIRPLLSRLDALPFPDYELFDMDMYLQARNGAIDMITGRGCPYKCSYCINYEIQRIQGQSGKKYMRKNSVEYVIQHIRSVTQKYDVRFIAFEDDLFVANKNWIVDFCEEYNKESFDIPFSCNNRVEIGDTSVFKHLKDAGCENVHMGIEAGDEYIRKTILLRKMSDDKIIKAFEAAKSAGLNTTSYNMLGLPHETKEQMKKTIELNQRIQPDHLGVSIFCPYPGTALFDLCVREGLIDPDFKIPKQHRSQVLLKHKPIFKMIIKYYKKTFRYKVYKKYNYRKAFIFLIFDTFYDLFIAIRNNIPVSIRRKMFRIYQQLIGH